MIKFTLRCGADHHFESWFNSSTAFDKLIQAGQVNCPTCGDTSIEKALMAPAVSTTKGKDDHSTFATRNTPATPQEAAAIAVLNAAREIREKLKTDADYVGDKFAQEARSRHETADEPDTPPAPSDEPDATDPSHQRPIWGEATMEEARDLIEDGITILPVPRLPEDEN
ncbi:MAG: DUF1178 family protein [Pseudomonadota bacterium]